MQFPRSHASGMGSRPAKQHVTEVNWYVAKSLINQWCSVVNQTSASLG